MHIAIKKLGDEAIVISSRLSRHPDRIVIQSLFQQLFQSLLRREFTMPAKDSWASQHSFSPALDRSSSALFDHVKLLGF
jgi:hypothetical protein